MDPTIEAAFIAGGSTAIVAIAGFVTTWAVTTRTIRANSDGNIRTIRANSDDNMRALDAAWEERLLEKKAAVYGPVASMLRMRVRWLLKQDRFLKGELLNTTEFRASVGEFESSVSVWDNLGTDVELLASTEVYEALAHVRTTDNIVRVCYRDVLEALVEHLETGSASKPASERLTSSLSALRDAFKRVKNADMALHLAMTADLAAKPSLRLRGLSEPPVRLDRP
jgi:hypothetical protein